MNGSTPAGGHPTLGGSSGGVGSALATTPNLILAPVPPIDFPFWIDADDTDGTANSTTPVGTNLTTLYNKGRYTNAGAAVNFTKQAGNLILTQYSGRMGNRCLIQSDGTGWASTGAAIPALPNGGYTVHCAFLCDDLTAAGSFVSVFDQVGTRGGMFVNGVTGAISAINSGGGPIVTGVSLFAQRLNFASLVFNGAASFLYLNGVQGPTITLANNAPTGWVLWALTGGAFIGKIRIGQWAYAPDVVNHVIVQQWLRAKYGVPPQ